MNTRHITYWLVFILTPFILLAQAQQVLSADVQQDQGSFSKKELELKKMINKDRKNDLVRMKLGNLYYENKKFKDAHRQYNQALIGRGRMRKSDLYHNLGNALLNEGKYEEAIEAYKSALYANPNDDQTRYNLTVAKKMKQKQDKQNKKKKQNQKEQGDNKGQKKKQDDKNDDKNSNGKGKKNDKESEKPKDDQSKNEKKRKRTKKTSLTDQQIENLLKAMEQEENKTLDKINKPKGKGAAHGMGKDW